MPIVRFRTSATEEPRLGLLSDQRITPFPDDSGLATISQLLQWTAAELGQRLKDMKNDAGSVNISDVHVLAPIDTQEVWACGVTYRRSRDARMEESTQRDVYDTVYDADRPEMFLKATPRRVSGPGGTITIRSDSTWDVPEPELALVINRHGEVIGYTIGNDVSSRSIEGENPLYLPQAKIYTGCAAVGPVITLAQEIPDPLAMTITLVIERGEEELFRGDTSTSEIHRSLDELVRYLHKGNSFPDGVLLMTGTGIIPPDVFTLKAGDTVHITIEGLGTLTNSVALLDVDS